jgi:glycine dehydrogenase
MIREMEHMLAQVTHYDRISLQPSSGASMCGMTIVPVKCDDRGQTCMEDLKEKLEKYGNELSCIMITYPSTYGIFEPTAIEICDLVH